jgi:hypothetical protein
MKRLDRRLVSAVIAEAVPTLSEHVRETLAAHGGHSAVEVTIDTVTDRGHRHQRDCVMLNFLCLDEFFFSVLAPPIIVRDLVHDRLSLERNIWRALSGFGYPIRGPESPSLLYIAAITSDKAAVCLAAIRNIVRRLRNGSVVIEGEPVGVSEDVAACLDRAENVRDQPDDGGWAALRSGRRLVQEVGGEREDEVMRPEPSGEEEIDLDQLSAGEGGTVSSASEVEGGHQSPSFTGCTMTIPALALTASDGCHNVACAHSASKQFFAAYDSGSVIRLHNLSKYGDAEAADKGKAALRLHNRVVKHKRQVFDYVSAASRGHVAEIPDDEISRCASIGQLGLAGHEPEFLQNVFHSVGVLVYGTPTLRRLNVACGACPERLPSSTPKTHSNWTGPAREIGQCLKLQETFSRMLFDGATLDDVPELRVYRSKALPKIAELGVRGVGDLKALCLLGAAYHRFAKKTHCEAIKSLECAPHPSQCAAQLIVQTLIL